MGSVYISHIRAMAFDPTAKVSLTLDQVLVLVDQFSEKEIEKVAERLNNRRKQGAAERMRKAFSKVKLSRTHVFPMPKTQEDYWISLLDRNELDHAELLLSIMEIATHAPAALDLTLGRIQDVRRMNDNSGTLLNIVYNEVCGSGVFRESDILSAIEGALESKV